MNPSSSPIFCPERLSPVFGWDVAVTLRKRSFDVSFMMSDIGGGLPVVMGRVSSLSFGWFRLRSGRFIGSCDPFLEAVHEALGDHQQRHLLLWLGV